MWDIVQVNTKEYARFQESYGTILKVRNGLAHLRRGEIPCICALYNSAGCKRTHCAIDAGSYGCTEEKRKVKGKDN